jgi:exosome complex component CSL4
VNIVLYNINNITLLLIGIIKREDITERVDETIPIYDYYMPFDIILAEVISIGDSKYYYLKTSLSQLGKFILNIP